MKNLYFFSLLLAIIWLTSCSKDLTDQPVKPPANLSELRVASDFNWSTGKTVEIDITGLPTTEPVYSTLSIGLADGSTLYQEMHNINTDTKLSVIVPVATTTLSLRFGNNAYELVVGTGKVAFSFVPVVQE